MNGSQLIQDTLDHLDSTLGALFCGGLKLDVRVVGRQFQARFVALLFCFVTYLIGLGAGLCQDLFGLLAGCIQMPAAFVSQVLQVEPGQRCRWCGRGLLGRSAFKDGGHDGQ